MSELEQADEQRSFETKKAQILEDFKKHGDELHVAPRHSVRKKLQNAVIESRELHDLVMRLSKEGQTFEELIIKALRYYEKNLSLAELD